MFITEKSSCKTSKFQSDLGTVARRCSVKKMFLKILQNSQENTCTRVSLLKKRPWHWCFPVNFVKYLRTHFYRTPLVAASADSGTESGEIDLPVGSDTGDTGDEARTIDTVFLLF